MSAPTQGQIVDIEAWRAERIAASEPPPIDRTEFERDADRIWYAPVFSRLQGVVQVASAPRRIVFHNRYTHSVKVGQLGRRLAERLARMAVKDYDGADGAAAFLAWLGGLDSSVTEAVGLGHDLGHPPFGHHGETILNRLAGPGGFNGNAQTFRVVSKLAVRDIDPVGLNLTRATLLGLVKYPWPRSHEPGRDVRWGYYASEKPLWSRLLESRPSGLAEFVGTGEAPSLEACVMDWADDVTYAVHDVEDFFRAGLIPHQVLTTQDDVWSQIIEQGRRRPGSEIARMSDSRVEAYVGNLTRLLSVAFPIKQPFNGSRRHEAILTLSASELIGRYMKAASLRVPSREDPLPLAIGEAERGEVAILKELAWFFVISRPGLAGIQYGQARMLEFLFSHYLDALKRHPEGEAEAMQDKGDRRILPVRAVEWVHDGEDATTVARDLVASMEEDQVRGLFRRLTGIDPGSVIDSIV